MNMILDVVDLPKVDLDEIYASHGNAQDTSYLGTLGPNLLPLTNHLPIAPRFQSILSLPGPQGPQGPQGTQGVQAHQGRQGPRAQPAHKPTSMSRMETVGLVNATGLTYNHHQMGAALRSYVPQPPGHVAPPGDEATAALPASIAPAPGHGDGFSKDQRMRMAVLELLRKNPQKIDGFRELRSTARKYDVSKSTLNRRAKDVAAGASLDSIGNSQARKGGNRARVGSQVVPVLPTATVHDMTYESREVLHTDRFMTMGQTNPDPFPLSASEKHLSSMDRMVIGGSRAMHRAEKESERLGCSNRSGRVEKRAAVESQTSKLHSDVNFESDQCERLLKAARELVERNGPNVKSGFKGLRFISRKYDVPRTTLNRRAQELANGGKAASKTPAGKAVGERTPCKTLTAVQNGLDPSRTAVPRVLANSKAGLVGGSIPDHDPADHLHSQLICDIILDILKSDNATQKKLDMIWEVVRDYRESPQSNRV